MNVTVERLQAEVLSLSKADRSRLLDRLIASLDQDAEIERDWDHVAEARAAELRYGTTHGVPLEGDIAALGARFPG